MEELAGKVQNLVWHQSIDLGPDLVTPGAKSKARCAAEADAIFSRLDLGGATVLDIGAWNGFFSFEAKSRGAARVLATDSYCWSHPRFRGRETFDLARVALKSEVEALEIDPTQLSVESVGQFDVVLFLGVFYHRYDIVEVLARIAPIARKLLIVETHLALRHVQEPAMAFYPGSELNGDESNWWAPNEQCVEAILRGHGFSEVEVSVAIPTDENRAIFHAWRSADLRQRPVPDDHKLKAYRPKRIRMATHRVLEAMRRLRKRAT